MFVIFYLMTVFSLSYATTDLGFSRRGFLIIQLFSILFFLIGIPVSALLADKFGRRKVLILVSTLILLFGFTFSYFLESQADQMITTLVCIGMGLMGLIFGPLGTFLSELFPTEVRYTGASLTFNLGGILGASFAPLIAIWLTKNYGIGYVGLYLAFAAIISVLSLLAIRKKEEKF